MEQKKLKILYAEDNRITARETTEALEENGYNVITVYDGNEAWVNFQFCNPDIVLLDYQMPGKTGLEVYKLIRQQNSSIPVLILSSYTELCAASLKMGTSDFIRKDGGIDETCARIEAAWQRRPVSEISSYTSNDIYQLSPICFYQSGNLLLNINNQYIPINGMIAEILTLLCQNQNTYLSKGAICKKIWNNDNPSKISLLSDYISKLRQILKADPSLEIRSSYGKGYCLKTPNHK